MSIQDCRLIDLPKVADQRGNLTFVESGRHVPFDIQRVFYLSDVPGGSRRAGHALKQCHQFLIAISGSFDVLLDDGAQQHRFRLDRSDCGAYITPLIWREIENFSATAVCLVLASAPYSENDYHRDYASFIDAVRPGP